MLNKVVDKALDDIIINDMIMIPSNKIGCDIPS